MCRTRYFPEKSCPLSNSNWRNRRGKFSGTVSEKKRLSNNCQSPNGLPVCRCDLSPASCVNFTGMRLQRNGRSFSKRSEEHTSELQSLTNLVCRLLLGKK